MDIPVELPEWMLSLLIGCIVAVIVLLGMPENDVVADGEIGSSQRAGKKRSLLLNIFYPLIASVAQLISLVPLGSAWEKLDKQLIKAGRPGGLSVEEFHATRLIAVFFAVMAGMFFDSELDLTPVCALGLGILGFVYPDIWLKEAVQKRRRRIFRDLPDILDTLRLAVDAGFDLSSALNVVVERGRKGPLLDELELVDREVQLGRTRREAFRNFADRIGMGEINSFVVALNQADQLGASIGPVLRAQSEMSRSRRWQLAEALVNKMPMKMLGPLVVFIFPSSFIILFTPLLIQWMQSG